MKLFKLKQGFTLIELLVVIGILAVLAAIAIPSVAGLIDRANVSADATNANEMTNAIERFTSEYELYCQDLASGKIDTDNLDAAQGRVFNVTGADDRADIELLEGAGLNGKQINIDTKYPENIATLQAVVENYMKTSSTTFTPKQSDCHYFYNPDCGLVVCAETGSSVDELNALVQSGKDAKGNTLTPTATWVDVTADVSLSGGSTPSDPTHNHYDTIPEGGTYYVGVPAHAEFGVKFVGNYAGATATYTAGNKFPSTINDGDVYVYGDYEYRFNEKYEYSPLVFVSQSNLDGWCVVVRDTSKSAYDEPLHSINGKMLKSMDGTYANCSNLKTPPTIPSHVTSLYHTFFSCGLETPPIIPDSVTKMEGTFALCSKLKQAPVIPNSVTNINNLFNSCYALTTAPVIPKNVINMDSTFADCFKLQGVIEINVTNVENCNRCFNNAGCIGGNPNNRHQITLTGSAPQSVKEALASTGGNNISIK